MLCCFQGKIVYSSGIQLRVQQWTEVRQGLNFSYFFLSWICESVLIGIVLLKIFGHCKFSVIKQTIFRLNQMYVCIMYFEFVAQNKRVNNKWKNYSYEMSIFNPIELLWDQLNRQVCKTCQCEKKRNFSTTVTRI